MAKVQIKGVVVPNDIKWIYELFEVDAVSPKDIDQQLADANGEDLEVEINSPGGDVYSGSEIYTALKSYAGNITVKIVGVAASAASVIAMAGNKVMISPTAQIMIHNVSGGAYGDYRALEHGASVLKNYNTSISNAYQLKTGMEQKELLGLMNKETWLNAQQAVQYGFANEVMFDEGNQLVASISSFMFPPKVIDKMRNLFKNQTGQIAGLNFAQGKEKQEPAPTPQPVNKKEDDGTVEIKNVDELRQNFPDLVAQVEAAAREEGATGERQRMQAIDEISVTVAPELVAKAKYEEPMTAEKLAFEALRADAAKGQQYVATRGKEIDNSGAGQVPAGGGSTMTDAEKDAAMADKIAAAANAKRNRGDKK